MARIPGIRGISYQQHGPSYRLKWRETHDTPAGPVRLQRYWTVHSMSEVPALAAEIRRALDDKGYWTEPDDKTRPMERDLERLSVEWLNEIGGHRGHQPATRSALKGALKRFWTALRAVTGTGDTDILATSVMTPNNIRLATGKLRETYVSGTVYQTVHPVVEDFWPWASDLGIGTLQPAPRHGRSLLPKNPVYEPPPDSPTYAEIDAMLGRITVPRAIIAGVLMRATGLRIDQSSYIEGIHFDVSDDMLLVTKGKSRKEQSTMRRVPVPPWLIPVLMEIGAWRSGFLIRQMDRYGNVFEARMKSARNLTKYFADAWERAEAEEVVRTGIWDPVNRARASTSHCLRARYQDHLRDAGIPEYVIDYMVGHAPKTTRSKSYANPPMRLLREAASKIPPISEDALDRIKRRMRLHRNDDADGDDS